MRHGGRAERALSVAANAHDGAVGAHGVHQTITATAARATTDLPNQRNEVSLRCPKCVLSRIGYAGFSQMVYSIYSADDFPIESECVCV